jgi:hypothetical protein
VASFVSLLERKYLSTATEFRPVEFAHKCQYFALDVIGDISFGGAFGFLENGQGQRNFHAPS